MRIERLRLSNYRGFAELDLEFPKQGTTVLVGDNGAGKTSVLDAIGTLLQRLVTSMPDEWPFVGATGEPLAYTDVGAGSWQCSVQLSAVFTTAESTPVQITWGARFPEAKNSDKTRDDALDQAAAAYFDPSTRFPVLTYFSVERVFRGELSSWLTPRNDPEVTAEAARSPISTEYSDFVRWFFDRENLENELIREQPSFRDSQLSAVRSAIERLCQGFSNLRIRRARVSGSAQRSASSTKFVVDKLVNGRKELFELDQLSHGERGLIALVGLIASQLAQTEGSDPLDGPGVVLIDEIELHLHPGWQRDIVPRLERTFPNVQFIVTTHSPQVLSQLRPENIKIIENFKLVERTPPTYGRDSNAILEDVMGVSERPAFATEGLSEIAALIDDEKWLEARERLQGLARDLGALDAEVVRLRTMIDMLDDARDAAK